MFSGAQSTNVGTDNWNKWQVVFSADEKQEPSVDFIPPEGKLLITHCHPTATEVTKVFLAALRKKDFDQASQYLNRLEKCSIILSGSTGRKPERFPHDEVLIRKCSKDCGNLHRLLLKYFIKAQQTGLQGESEFKTISANNFFETVQKPFIAGMLRELGKNFQVELQSFDGQAWERASFERAVKILIQIEKRWEALKDRGLQPLFDTNFFHAVARDVVEPLLNKINGDKTLSVLLDDNRAKKEEEKLVALFNQYQPDLEQAEITADEIIEALDFLIFSREKSLK